MVVKAGALKDTEKWNPKSVGEKAGQFQYYYKEVTGSLANENMYLYSFSKHSPSTVCTRHWLGSNDWDMDPRLGLPNRTRQIERQMNN